MNAAPVQDIHEAELARWLFTERMPAALLASELRFAPATGLTFCVDPSHLMGDARAPGDIDVLAIDHARLDQAIAIEIKRVKLPPKAYLTARPNKLQDLDKGCRQVRLLRSMGFHRSYLVVAVVADGREQTDVGFPFRGPPPALVKVVRDKLRSLPFHPDVGVFVVEVTQPVDKDIRDSGAVGIWTHQHAQDVEQPAALTDGLRAFLRAAPDSSPAELSRFNPPRSA
jgi:hypothetical protein